MHDRYSSHDAFDHESLDSLGYDWERIAHPSIQPKYPRKIYLPRETAHVVAAVEETNRLGQKLRIRSMGHSNNDLVTEEDGNLLCTQKLNRILKVEDFVTESQALVTNPGASPTHRGMWVDLQRSGRNMALGQYCTYCPTEQTRYTRVQKELAFGYLHLLGRWAGRLPRALDERVRILGIAGIVLSPRYGSIRDIECLTDRIIDYSVGEPSRMQPCGAR